MDNENKGCLLVVGAFLLAIGLFMLIPWLVMSLWNWLMPMIFGLCTIGYWEAFGLYILSSFLFRGFDLNLGRKKDD